MLFVLTSLSLSELLVAQPEINKPPEKSPFNEDAQSEPINYNKDGYHALTFDVTMALRGIAAFNYLQKIEKYPAFFKIGLGKSFGEDLLSDTHKFATEGLSYGEVENLIASNIYSLKSIQTGVGYNIVDWNKDLSGMGIMLHYNYGRLNVPISEFETPIKGVDKVKFRKHMLGASYHINYMPGDGYLFFLTGLNFGVALDTYAINKSILIDDANPYYSMSKKMTLNSSIIMLLNIQFGFGW